MRIWREPLRAATLSEEIIYSLSTVSFRVHYSMSSAPTTQGADRQTDGHDRIALTTLYVCVAYASRGKSSPAAVKRAP